jgi:DDE superfamily endonuclease
LFFKIFSENIKQFHPYSLIYLDESHFESKMQGRNYGYSQKGETAETFSNKPESKRYSLICVMTAYDILTYQIIDTTDYGVNGEIFIEFLEQVTMLMHQQSILLMDNARIHHVDSVYTTMTQFQLDHIYLPPYS